MQYLLDILLTKNTKLVLMQYKSLVTQFVRDLLHLVLHILVACHFISVTRIIAIYTQLPLLQMLLFPTTPLLFTAHPMHLSKEFRILNITNLIRAMTARLFQQRNTILSENQTLASIITAEQSHMRIILRSYQCTSMIMFIDGHITRAVMLTSSGLNLYLGGINE